jgi:soluble lytic murein transglycosylase-like protein
MKEKKHSSFFRIVGLILWIFVATTNIIVLAKTVDISARPSKKTTRTDIVSKEGESASSAAVKLSIDTYLRIPSLPEKPPDQNSLKIKYYNQIIERASVLYQIDPDLISAVVMVESRYKPQAGSRKSAKGLMQLMPATAKELGVLNILNPEENILAGTKYLRQLLDKLEGDVELALAAYNAGYRKVLRYQGVPPYKETQAYIANVFKYYTFYKIESLRKERIR